MQKKARDERLPLSTGSRLLTAALIIAILHVRQTGMPNAFCLKAPLQPYLLCGPASYLLTASLSNFASLQSQRAILF